jgi:hypothetical protein
MDELGKHILHMKSTINQQIFETLKCTINKEESLILYKDFLKKTLNNMLPQGNFSIACSPKEMDAKMFPRDKKIMCFLKEMPLEFFLLKITPNVLSHMNCSLHVSLRNWLQAFFLGEFRQHASMGELTLICFLGGLVIDILPQNLFPK